MKDPVIIFCEKGHIYDAALNEECPYCKRVNKNKERLNSVLGNEILERNHSKPIANESDETELLVVEDDKTEMLEDIESEETELLDSNDNNSDETELLNQSNEYIIPSTKRDYVQSNDHFTYGWLVCVSGPKKGKSYELRRYNLLMVPNEKNANEMQIKYDPIGKNQSGAYAEIIASSDGLFSLVSIGNHRCFVEGVRVNLSKPITAYDSIEVCDKFYRFIPFVGEQFRWESKR